MLPSVPGKVMTRILLERQGESVYKKLRQKQAGSRKNKSCADQVATLRIDVEQFMEWQAPLHLHFLDFEKTSDSVDCNVIWSLLKHYRISTIFVELTKEFYKDAT